MSAPLARLAGHDLDVPLATGGSARYVNLDNAASTSPLHSVMDVVSAMAPWYSSVHRGAGFASQVSTRLYEHARRTVAEFVGADEDDHVVVFVRNSTEALNLLARTLHIDTGSTILLTPIEHHANLLPWRRAATTRCIPIPESPEHLLTSLEQMLAAEPTAIVAVTGASNVTGEVFPIADIAALAHRHGAIVVVDAAQLAPHRAIDMRAAGIDCLALSGHKMYAPFGSGAVVAARELLADAEPMLAGGGAVDLVTLESVAWTRSPDRHEAGSPNVVGAVAMAAAMTTLSDIGMDAIAEHEHELLQRLIDGTAAMPHIRRHLLWEDGDHLGVFTFTVEGMSHALVAAALAAEWGIGVRHGCFCAHPYISALLGLNEVEAEQLRTRIVAGEHPQLPGAVRASFGVGTTTEDIDHLLNALADLTSHGPRLDYKLDEATGDYYLVDDSRTWPHIPGLPPIDQMVAVGAGCGQV